MRLGYGKYLIYEAIPMIVAVLHSNSYATYHFGIDDNCQFGRN